MTNWIQRFVNDLVGPPVRVPTKEDRLRQIKNNVRGAIIGTLHGNYTTREELEELREENLRYFQESESKLSAEELSND